MLGTGACTPTAAKCSRKAASIPVRTRCGRAASANVAGDNDCVGGALREEVTAISDKPVMVIARVCLAASAICLGISRNLERIARKCNTTAPSPLRARLHSPNAHFGWRGMTRRQTPRRMWARKKMLKAMRTLRCTMARTWIQASQDLPARIPKRRARHVPHSFDQRCAPAKQGTGESKGSGTTLAWDRRNEWHGPECPRTNLMAGHPWSARHRLVADGAVAPRPKGSIYDQNQ